MAMSQLSKILVLCLAPLAVLTSPALPQGMDSRESAAVLRQASIPIGVDELRRTLFTDAPLVAFPDVQLDLIVDSLRAGTISDLVVRARLRDEPSSWARFVLNHEGQDLVVQGDIFSPARGAFEIRWMPDRTHVVRQVDRTRRFTCGGALPPTQPPTLGVGPLAPSTAEPVASRPLIDVMVVHTPSATSMAGGLAAIEATIESYVDYANQVYADSGALQRLRLVHAAEIAYVEHGNSLTDLARLKEPNDGFMDDVHPLRDAVSADCVVLIATSGSAGVGYQMSTVSPSFADCAFSTVGHDAGGIAFTHELGHNMGCGHNNGPTAPAAAFCYSYGHRTPDNLWRTIMSYSPGSYVDFMSGPNNTFAGWPLGVDGAGCPLDGADNVTTLNLTASVVAAFR